MDDETTVSSAYVFRGIEYIVTMCVQDGNTVTVEVEDKLTADQWRAEFDSAYIEDLTHKTGNFKQFNIFISMLESAVIQASDSVSLDLLTYADLESLRQRKAGSAVKSTIPAQRTVSLNSKRYLILTYTVEFDRIHYPLPLPYMGKPDPRTLQEQIRVLRAEIKALKQQGTSETKLKELEKLRKEHEALRKEKEDTEAEFLQYRREMKTTSHGNAVKELKMFKSMARSLEEDLMKEKTKHQRQASKHGQQYRELLEELEEIRASERNLRIRVKSLTNELAMFKRGKAKPNPQRSSRVHSRERKGSFDNYSSRERSVSRERNRSLSRDRSWSSDRLSLRDRSNDRLSSRDRSRERPSSGQNRSRVSDRSDSSYRNSYHRQPPSPGIVNTRFDPSAYIKDKERKKKEAVMKKQRQTKANISGSSMSSKQSAGNRLSRSRMSSSAHSRPRSRNSSYGSQVEFSDGGMSDSSYSGQRNYSNGSGSRNRKTVKSKVPSYLSSPEVPNRRESKTTRNRKILASTPESDYGKRRSVRDKENIPLDESDYFDRSAEISEIDERLSRLQKLMKTSMS